MAELGIFYDSAKTTTSMVEQGAVKIKFLIIMLTLAVVITITAAGVLFFQDSGNILSEDYTPVRLSSAFNNWEEYSDVFTGLTRPSYDVHAEAGIVSHHFLAKKYIAEFYNKISTDRPLTIYLLSPNHKDVYLNDKSVAYTADVDWDTPFGEVSADTDKIHELQKKENIERKISAMGLEHGIYTEVPFIKYFFPNAKIVPLVLKNNAPLNKFFTFGREIRQISDENTLLLVSSDFSHEVSDDQSRSNDRSSIQVLDKLNSDDFSKVTNDCKACLAVLSGYTEKSNATFTLVDNRNSYEVSGENPGSVTSYVFGYYGNHDTVKIMFVGDSMFDRGIRYYAEKNGGYDYIFNKISPALADNDLVVANLEGPITSNASKSINTAVGSADNFFFTFNPVVARELFSENIRLVDLGNNHIMNQGSNGLTSTQNFLRDEDVSYFGLPAQAGVPDDARSIVKNINGVKIGFISYNQFANDIADEVAAEIRKIKPSCDVVVVFSHWGVEYSTSATEDQKTLAHQFIDAGADLVIGAHPHVIENIETYKDKKIYYSLGNFIFDQYFSKSTETGMGVVMEYDKKTKTFTLTEKYFTLKHNGQTELK